MKNKKQKSDIVIYQTPGGSIEFRGDFKKETIWATQSQIADLFNIDRSVITKHIGKIFSTGEVNKKSNVQKMHIANSDKPVAFYSLDIILAVGYKANSGRAIAFRKWATKTLKEHLIKGYTINEKRLLSTGNTTATPFPRQKNSNMSKKSKSMTSSWNTKTNWMI